MVVSIIALAAGLLSSAVIAFDVYKHPQMMWIMNIVWPINGWFLGPVAVYLYWKWGKLKAKDSEAEDNRGKPAKVFGSTSHCASGCTAGDVLGVPIVFMTSFTLFGMALFAHYFVEFILAYIFGVVFQFFAIYPMNKEDGILTSLKNAIKADTLALISFQIGMFGWMAIVHFILFSQPPKPNEPSYWFMMQIAMIIGFLTSYPVNWWLVRKGIKEEM
ncbi:DUF4396 domain-containing protein [Sediminibacillus massiliensis]|uniref:DUF4396 domain-containing protein n=1 Tax=Sediminibacillus massiliensis TaxID=1926277 RepID=UPI0009886694|nr:DUF4396 domain-containing protein [Sediminibacillus massiliensis]